MGCSSVSNMYGKSEMLNKFFQQCELSGYSSSQIIKTTEYQYEYVRSLREWRKIQTKTIFNDSNPVLLGPVQFEQFEALKVQLKEAPFFKSENFSQVLQIGDVFPRFKATLLNRPDQTTFDTQLLKPTIFIYWKLDETKSLNPILYQTRSTVNRFQDDKRSKFIQTAYQRAKVRLSEQYNLVGLCCDSQDKKSQYEQFIQQDETHIWLEDQSQQVFKYAEDENYKIRSFENSIYLVNNGIFVVSLQENFSDQSFVEGINKHTLKKLDQQEIEFNRKEQFKKKIQFEIRRDDYQKLKQIIMDSLPKKTNQMQIGDTFKLAIRKLTYYYNYRKCGATYQIPILWAAGSQKYQIGFQELVSWLRDQTPFAHLKTDFFSRHTMNKEKFFTNLSNQIKSQYNDMNFILEKTQMIVYDSTHKKFVLHRTLDQIYNTPLSVGSVFARKEFMQNLKIQTQDYVDQRLLKNYLQNPYIITTCFQIGSLYTPIPNLYKVTHNDQSVILSNTIKPQLGKGIYDSKLMNSVNQSGLQFPDVEKIESNVSEIIECLEDQQELQDLNYEQQDSLQHVNQEVLLIYIIDFKNQSESLAQLLEFINNNGWQNSQIRVAVISQQNDKDFEYSIHRYKLEKYMSNGLFEPWFPIQNTFLGVNFYRMLSDLYGLNQESPLIIIDQLKRVLFRGLPDKQFPTLLKKIMNGQSAKHIHAPDRALKHRIDKAQYQQEWYKLKSYGYQSIKYSNPIQEVIKYVQMQPLGANDIWMIKQTQFQLWNHEGIRKRKFYERPQVIYKFEKPELSVKFYHISEEIQNLIGKDRIDLLDIINSKQAPQQYDNLIQ